MRILFPVAAAAMLLAGPAVSQQATNAAAGNFRLTDMNGRTVQLSDFRGRTVVLEWNNPDCPYVKKHYAGNMQRTQAGARRQNVVWLTINSGAPGKQGNMTAAQAQAYVAGARATPTHYLLDPEGRVGRGYGAKTTPHLYIVDGQGRLRYQGGIDDRPTNDVADIAGARNHVTAALSEMAAGRPVSVPETRPYGCSVKYA